MKKLLAWVILLGGASGVAYMALDGRIPGIDIAAQGNGGIHDPHNGGSNAPGANAPRRPTVNVSVSSVEDKSVIHKKLRKRTEFMISGLTVEGTLRNDHFELIGDDGDRYAAFGFVIYRKANGEWKRSDVDVKSPRQMVMFSRTASGITRSIYTEGTVDVDKDQAIVLFFSGSGLTGKLSYQAEQMRANYVVEAPPDEKAETAGTVEAPKAK